MAMPTAAKSRLRRRSTWLIAGIILILLLVAGFFLARRFADRAAASTPQTGDVVTAFIGDLAASATASGQIEAERSTLLSPAAPGLVADVFVREGAAVARDEPLVQLDTADLALQLARAQQNVALQEANLEGLLAEPEAYELASAEAAVSSAQAALDDFLAGPDSYDLAESEATIRQQQAGVASASASYRSTVDSISEAEIATAEAELINAEIAYDQAVEANEKDTNGITHEAMLDAAEKLAIARAKVEELRGGPNQGRLNSASADISSASANLSQAQANYESLASGPSEDQIAAAEATLAQAESNLAALTDGPSNEEIVVAQAELEQARLALLDAREALEKATIKAPFEGIVTAVSVTPGELADGPVAELIANQFKVVLSVDEIDVGQLAPGQSAIITLEAWPEQDIPGSVVSIAPSAGGDESGLVTYDVQVNLEEPEDLPIRSGMTANARLITERSPGILLVPNGAVTADRQNGTYTVNLVIGEGEDGPLTEEVPVTIGLRDDDYTQITSGISAGDQVLVGELAAPTIQFGAFGQDE